MKYMDVSLINALIDVGIDICQQEQDENPFVSSLYVILERVKYEIEEGTKYVPVKAELSD